MRKLAMIVVIIVGILAAAAVPIYRFALKRAYTTEAKASLGAIRAAELVHQAEFDTFLAVAAGNMASEPTDTPPGLGIDVTNNTWFNDAAAFSVVAVADIATDFIANCDGGVIGSPVSDIAVSITEDGIWGTFTPTGGT